jgi:predicted dehydrogenase
MATEVRVGVIGMGIGKPNAKAFAANPRSRVVALCDLVQEKMDRFAKDLPGPVKTYTDYAAMCRDEDVDAVFVGTPNQLHVPVALAAVRNGKHVMVTKPLADSLDAAERLVEAAGAAKVVNMMSLSARFDAPCRFLKSQIVKGALGEIYYARARSVRRSGIPDWSEGFVRAGGGAFRDMGVHVLDAAWYLLGMPEPASATGVAGARFGPRGLGYWEYRTPPESLAKAFAADDYAGGFIRFAPASAGERPGSETRKAERDRRSASRETGLQIESFWASHQPEEFQIELFGTEAGARLSPLTIYGTRDGAAADTVVALPKGLSPWDVMAAHFVACVLDGEPCQAPLSHGLAVQRMMEAVLESAAEGREVRLS